MSASILHRCPFCGHVTDISVALAAFVENPHCNQCGLSASEGNLKLQDDLVALFNRQLNMETPSLPKRQEIQPSTPPITYSITQHYHHSAHVVQQAATPRFPTGNPLSQEANQTAEHLRNHNIDPSTLSQQQLELFENGIPEQQSRLIQIWQLCPEHTGNGGKGMSANRVSLAEDLEMCDSAQEKNMASEDSHQYAEPYMISGYEMTNQEVLSLEGVPSMNQPTSGSVYRLANDPIYQAQGQRWWERSHSGSMGY